jgi:putative tricarboxylic transport membrane protein
MFEILLDAFVQTFTLNHLFYLIAGVVLGLIIGIIPGLGGSAGLALTLPFVIGVEPSAAIGLMIGLQSVTATSDTFPAVLVGVPGTASAQATVLDGFEMSKQGRAAEALGAAFSSSLIGGLFGAAILTVAIGFAEPIILAFGLAEQMMLVVLAVALIGSLTGANIFKGLATACIGMLIGTVGSAPTTAIPRFTFESIYLLDNIKVVLVGLGLFAVPEILGVLRQQERIADSGLKRKGWIQGVKSTLSHWWLVIRCSAIGAALGALPGLGGSVIDWIAYAHARGSVKAPETLGTGDVRGVIAPEAANNAKEGGALIPTLLFGIPGSASMALLLGGFILVGIEPGINMIRNEVNLVYLMVWSVALANIAGAVICIALSNPIARVTTVPFSFLAPILLVFICFAAYQATKDIGDLFTVLFFGICGMFMKRYGWSRPALLIGFVLAPRMEASSYQVINLYGWSIFERPIVIILAFLALAILCRSVFRSFHTTAVKTKPHPNNGALVLPSAFLIFASYTLICSLDFDPLTAFFPTIISILTLIFLGLVAIAHFALPGFKIWEDEEPANKNAYLGVISFSGSIVMISGVVLLVTLFGILPVALVGVAVFLYCFAKTKALLAIGTGIALASILFLLSRGVGAYLPKGLLF